MAEKRFLVADDQYRTIHRKIRGIFLQLDHKKGSPLDPKLVADALQNIADGKFNQQSNPSAAKLKPQLVQSTSYLGLIPGLSSISTPPSDGRKLILSSGDVFRGRIDPDFKNYGLDKTGQPIKRSKCSGYEITSDSTFRQMFESFGTNLEKLWVAQSQVVSICSNIKNLRQEGYGNFFLIKGDETLSAAEDNLFVVDVHVNPDGLNARVRRFSHVHVWSAVYRHRLFVPQLISQTV
jgi:hypothetical protein